MMMIMMCVRMCVVTDVRRMDAPLAAAAGPAQPLDPWLMLESWPEGQTAALIGAQLVPEPEFLTAFEAKQHSLRR